MVTRDWSDLGAADFLQTASALAPMIAAQRDTIEAGRRAPAPLMHALRDAGLLSLWLPRTFGGPELTIASVIETVEELARADGSVGWCAAIAVSYSRLAGHLAEADARAIYGAGDAIVAGTLNPTGRADVVAGGYRVTGRWAFGSGIDNSTWVIGNCMVFDSDTPRRNPDGSPVMRIVFVPRADAQIEDTWHVAGLPGTGSQDYTITDIFVPEARSIPAFDCPPTQPGRLYALPLLTTFPTAIAAVSLGTARAAIDAMADLAWAKQPTGNSQRLVDQPRVQSEIGRAEVRLAAARALMLAQAEAAWEAADTPLPIRNRALVRLACVHAATTAREIVDAMFELGGGTSLYETGRLARCWRDGHAAAQHIALSTTNYEVGGRVLLGLPPGNARF